MLYVCATPIGNLGDVTPRLLETLRAVDIVAAEDTRHTRKLLSHFDIHVPLTSLFRHNEAQRTEEILRRLRDGEDVALVSDAGMPAVSDPGMRLIARAVAEEIAVTVLPGPSAVITALVAAGFESDSFCFAGYLPRRRSELEAFVHARQRCVGLVVAFETAPRLPKTLAVLARLAPDARIAICREMTKAHEEIRRGSAVKLSEHYDAAGPNGAREPARGEITLVIDFGASQPSTEDHPAADTAARALLARGLSRRDVAAALHICLRVPHREAESTARRIAAEGGSGPQPVW